MGFRIENDSMPLDGVAWSDGEKDLLNAFSCDLARIVDAVPPDEQFPAELLLPYDGPAVTDYDNTFLTYEQLRGRVLGVFDDDWVREGVDLFSENISLFGGADFVTTFVPAREASDTFLGALDVMAEDVCGRAANDGSGPFAGLDLDAAIVDAPDPVLTGFEAEGSDVTILGLPDGCRPGPGATEVVLCTNASIDATFVAALAGDFRFRAVVRPDPNPDGPPIVVVRVDGVDVGEAEVTAAGTVEFTGTVETAGEHIVSVAFVNDSVVDGDDRNLFVNSFDVFGPLPGTTDGSATGTADAKAAIATIMARTLQRPVDVDNAEDAADVDGLYGVLADLDDDVDADRRGAWAGVCEALLHHPDWLFARPPRFDGSTDAGLRERLLVTQTALLVLDRPATDDELLRFDVGEVDRAALIDAWLASDEFHAAYTNKVRNVLEFDGTPDGDEPARLWAFIAREGRPIRDVLTADYTVDVDGNEVGRPAEHGKTGLLTMKGYISGKPGLPHYNYAARVLTGFLGLVFEVPQEALDARATATASSTVDPQSLCFSCHRLLTPLAHQRLRWDDDGNFREAFDDGRVIDDSDNNLVADYPFRGTGLEAFSLVAVKKEAFARRMANAHFLLVFGRLMRHSEDERTVYRALFDVVDGGHGDFHALLKAVLLSSSFTAPPGLTPGAGVGFVGGEP